MVAAGAWEERLSARLCVFWETEQPWVLGAGQPGNPAMKRLPEEGAWASLEVPGRGPAPGDPSLLQVMGAYYAAVASPGSRGAAFLAVCRGKVSLVPRALPVFLTHRSL